MATWVQTHVNCHVRVKLTEYGRELHKSNYEMLRLQVEQRGGVMAKYSGPHLVDGWYQTQWWVLMKEFGRYVTLPGPQPFESIIFVEEDEGD